MLFPKPGAIAMTDVSGLMLLITVLGPLLLAAALVYGTIMWRRRRQSRASRQASDEATRRLYQREDVM
jgi:hypothetical protein